MAPKILLHGSGAIGTCYLYVLTKAGCDVTAVCRSNYDAAKANGFTLDSELWGKGIQIRPNVVRTPAEAVDKGPFDYVIVTAKALPGPKPSTADLIAPAVTKGKTCIALIQNGVGIEEEFAEAFPDNPLLSCVVYLPTTQVSPGVVQMGQLEKLEVGTFPASSASRPKVKEAAQTFVSTLKSGGSDVTWSDEIQVQRWSKLLINAPWNPIGALTLSRDVAYLASSSGAKDFVLSVMLEIVAIAQALGYKDITPEVANTQLQRAEKRVGTKGIEPSMLKDALASRRMEVEVLLGNPIRIGKKHGVSVVRLEALYALLKALDESLALRQPGQSLAGDETAAYAKQSS